MQKPILTSKGITAPGRVRFVNRCDMRSLDAPLRIIAAHRLSDVVPALIEVEREAERGYTAAGFVAYEAAPAFDPALAVHGPGPLPLVWFAVYAGAGRREALPAAPLSQVPAWRSACSPEDYRAAVDRVRTLIAAGDTYQVNFTFPMRAPFVDDPWPLFTSLAAAQPTDFGAYLDTGRFGILSVSPELFFRLEGDAIVCRPMKGTAPRGLWSEDDRARAGALRGSAKERAENVMIVDMVRNDLGRIAEIGSVRVLSLFDTEGHPTVWQMTSTVEARTRATLAEVFRALFPSASVTGAPKIRTMQIIRALEPAPRGVYCGAIGWVGPGRRAEFSVGIRTLTLDRESTEASYHVGSGITWDSAPQAEFEECRLKAAVLTHRRPEFDLLESLRWENAYWLLDGHLGRLRASAEYFNFSYDEAAIRGALDRVAAELRAPSKVRLTLSRFGHVEVEATALPEIRPLRVVLSPNAVDSEDVFLYHKTTHRALYDRERALYPQADDVIFWNERHELTESTRANLAVRFGDEWFTPPVSSGLLGGVLRAHLLAERRLRECVLAVDDLDAAAEACLINSVRGWMPIVWARELLPLAERS
jgi:para-aminobenzoate synthetase/4-amino-4-deoxychorismate lyase